MTENILENAKLESQQQEEREFTPSELRQKIHGAGYSILRKINDIKKQQRKLQEELEATEKEFDNFTDWLSGKIDTGWKKGWDMSEASKEYCELLKKFKDISYVGLLDYWGKA